ncbi:MAG TPA: membrane dipeptidase [bacterium]|nr:membrane dipeptidase [bacterium]
MKKKMIVFDNHCDTIVCVRKNNRNWLVQSEDGHWDVERFLNANGKYQVMAVCPPPNLLGDTAASFTFEVLGSYYSALRKTDRILTVKTKKDLDEVGEKLGIILAIEGANPLMGRETLLEMFFRAGVRLITLTWNHRNELADGIGVGGNYGLTNIGKNLVASMHEKGMAVDVSHLNEAGFRDTAEILKSGMMASHSNSFKICNHPRNLNDKQIKAIADRNGIIGFNFASGFICREKEPGKENFLAHLKHIKKVGGSKVLAFGGDLDGINRGLVTNALKYPLLLKWAGEILKDDELENFAWKNSYNFFKEILPDA